MAIDYSNPVAFVTGGASGIGRAVVDELLEKGFRVVAADLSYASEGAAGREEEKDGKKHEQRVFLDVRKQESVIAALEETKHFFGQYPSIIVNSAGILRPTRFLDIPAEEWGLMMDVNLNGVFYCAQEGVRRMLRDKDSGEEKTGDFYGRVVNLASQAGRSVSKLGGAHYTAGKAGVIGLTRAVAMEFGPVGITSTAVCPGIVESPMSESEVERRGRDNFTHIPAGRLGQPEEVAKLIGFLASRDSSYITGACVDINGGNLML